MIMIGPDVMELVSLFTSSYSFQIKHAGMGSFNTTMSYLFSILPCYMDVR